MTKNKKTKATDNDKKFKRQMRWNKLKDRLLAASTKTNNSMKKHLTSNTTISCGFLMIFYIFYQNIHGGLVGASMNDTIPLSDMIASAVTFTVRSIMVTSIVVLILLAAIHVMLFTYNVITVNKYVVNRD